MSASRCYCALLSACFATLLAYALFVRLPEATRLLRALDLAATTTDEALHEHSLPQAALPNKKDDFFLKVDDGVLRVTRQRADDSWFGVDVHRILSHCL
jgi:hypothetical protein